MRFRYRQFFDIFRTWNTVASPFDVGAATFRRLPVHDGCIKCGTGNVFDAKGSHCLGVTLADYPCRCYFTDMASNDVQTFGGWERFNDPDELAPLNDLRPHVFGMSCWCNPEEIHEVIVHNSLDQRELYEEGVLRLH